MKRYILTLVVIFVSVAVIIYVYPQHAIAKSINERQVVGVVDLTKVIQLCQASIDREKIQSKHALAVEDKLKALAEEVKNIEQELKIAISPNTPSFESLRQQFFDKRAYFEAYEKSQTELFASKYQDWLLMLYSTIMDEISKVSLGKKIDLVMSKEHELTRARNVQDLNTFIRLRKVLFSSNTIDITDLVIERMNKLHAQAK